MADAAIRTHIKHGWRVFCGSQDRIYINVPSSGIYYTANGALRTVPVNIFDGRASS